MSSEPSAIWIIERLQKQHDRSTFACGHTSLDQWLKQQAGQFDRRDLARTYVILRQGEQTVLGYYAISSHRVSFAALPQPISKGLPRMDIPVALLGKLAVDRQVQGQGVGRLLLVDALRRIALLAADIGIRAVEVDAIDDTARGFYLKYGFVPLLDDPRHLYLPVSWISKLGLA